ncbi:MAG TPA: MFS transporter [Gemmatimonadaceae bacterium]|nr:MFS transporter [Gemmatimonadaceae bacterium]
MTNADAATRAQRGLFAWWHSGDRRAHRALVAAGLGWMLDAFDVMLFAMVLATLMGDLGLTKQQGGLLGSVTLLAGAAGGLMFGFIADRFGRTRALMGSILLYSIFTALCGTAQTIWQLVAFRIFLGLGMGGEWASGAALVSETWPTAHRGKALGFMQSSWAIGYAAAAAVTGLVLPAWGWRAVFFVGVLPALFTIWVRRSVEEPALWLAQRDARRAAGGTLPAPAGQPARFADMFRGRLAALTAAVTLMNACTLFGWWGLNSWIGAYLSLPASQGGVGLSAVRMSAFVVAMQVGMWLGYITFGYVSDIVGRKRTYVVYLLAAAGLLPLYGAVREPAALLALGPLVAFFGTGCFSGFGALTAEIYPTAIRATAQGFTYNTGRIASAAAPWTVGSLAAGRGFAAAFAVAGAAYLLAAITWRWIPETKGRELT